ncbi:MAG: HlyD family efflux transporter periplasmic adaptor subunit, partial [Thermoanaerobaculia bacterium]|nr:HlyD family efflux transporter periplasmic adaptor subunit [Thermoanaerobaculia bacterium]
VKDVLVGLGDVVKKDQIVAHVSIPEIETQIEKVKADIEDLGARLEVQSGETGAVIGGYRAKLGGLYAQRRNMQQLVEKGLRTQKDLLQIDAQIADTNAQISQAQSGRDQRDLQLDDKSRELVRLEAQLAAQSELRSPVAGRVAQVQAAVGQPIKPGDSVVLIEDDTLPLRALVLIPEAQAKRVVAGMEVKIAPSDVKSEDFGFMKGKIAVVSESAASPQELDRILNNQAKTQEYMKQRPFLAFADLLPDSNPKNVSGFRWTSAVGPPKKITSGSLCTYQIIVEQKRPISYVIPMVKKTLGV